MADELNPGADLGLESPAAGDDAGAVGDDAGDAGEAGLTPEQITELQEKAGRVDTLEGEKTMLQTQLGIYQANMPNQGQPQQQGVNLMDGIEFEDDENDVAMASQLKQFGLNVQSYINTIAGMADFKMSTPDAETTIRKYLPAMIQNDPSIRTTLASIGSPAAQMAVAYKLIQANPKYIKATSAGNKTPEQLAAEAAAAAKIKAKGGTLPAGAAPAGGGNKNLAQRFLDMSEDELDAHIEAVKARG